MTLTAQGDPSTQQETVNAIVNARFTQTARVLQERTLTLAVQGNPTAQQETVNAIVNARFTQTAQVLQERVVTLTANAIQRTNAAATLAAGGIVPMATNNQWTPWEQEFEGVTMVLVPAGCFMMGSDSGDDDEKPIHRVCFEQPFWIDQTEVTRVQFRSFEGKARRDSYIPGNYYPVDKITWFEARDYCALRGARLPTEAEWEYVARGPEGLNYPWGNAFEEKNVVPDRKIVGSRPGGASWVGALDMSGNVGEWVSSLYQPYPYNANDGREADTGGRKDATRVLRGIGWDHTPSELRAARRVRDVPDGRAYFHGFRCARSYQ